MGTTRREALRAAAAAMTGVLAGTRAEAAQKPVCFTPDEFALLDEAAEIIIPADEHSGGARQAEVAAYLDRRLAEAFEAERKQEWKDGLARIDEVSGDLHGRRFLEAAPEQRVAVLTRMEKHEKFFHTLKAAVIEAYYSTEIGIKNELEYKGNTFQKEFSGYDVSKPVELP